MKKVIQDIASHEHIDEHSICAVVFELAEPDSQFIGFIQRASEQGPEKIAAAAAKKIGE